jgi:hypothetical protein
MPMSERAKRVLIGIALLIIGGLLGFTGFKMSEKSKHRHGIIDASDSPVTVRGGSLNFIANSGAKPRWYPNGNLFEADNVQLNNIYVDGVIPVVPGQTSVDPVPQPNPITPKNYWSITLALRDKGGQHITICTELVQGVCNTKSSTPLPSNKKGSIYIQGDASDSLGTQGVVYGDDYDRKGLNARLHYAVSDCTLTGTDVHGNPILDGDNSCDKILNFSIQDGPSSSSFECVEGACDIGIGEPPQ